MASCCGRSRTKPSPRWRNMRPSRSSTRLSDLEHPCQALADMLTLQEHFGDLSNVHLAYVGDGNNMAHSLMLAAASLGASISIATPEGYEPNPNITGAARALTTISGGECRSVATILWTLWLAPTRFTRTCGPAWGRNRRRLTAARFSLPTRSMRICSPVPPNTRCSCTACRRIAETRSRQRSSIRRVPWCSTRRRTVCTFRKPFLFCCWKAVIHRFPPRSANA